MTERITGRNQNEYLKNYYCVISNFSIAKLLVLSASLSLLEILLHFSESLHFIELVGCQLNKEIRKKLFSIYFLSRMELICTCLLISQYAAL